MFSCFKTLLNTIKCLETGETTKSLDKLNFSRDFVVSHVSFNREGVKKKRRIIAVCNETKRKFLFGTEMKDEERERRSIVRMVSYLALGGA